MVQKKAISSLITAFCGFRTPPPKKAPVYLPLSPPFAVLGPPPPPTHTKKKAPVYLPLSPPFAVLEKKKKKKKKKKGYRISSLITAFCGFRRRKKKKKKDTVYLPLSPPFAV